MDVLRLGEHIAQYRRKADMTQEQLAAYIGVSKSSVSKWETGTTYPDILFLPELANLFHVSLDELLGYEPQLSRDQIREKYKEFTSEIMKSDPETVLQRIKKELHQYQSCYPFLYQMTVFLINHADVFDNPEACYEMILKICQHILSNCDDMFLLKETQTMKAMAYLQLRQPENVLTLLGAQVRPQSQDQELIGFSYQMLGDLKEAKKVTQVCCYQYLLFLLQDLLAYMMMNIEDAHICDMTMKRCAILIDAFDMERLHPITAISYYINRAAVYAHREDAEECLTNLEAISHVCELHHGNLKQFKGDSFFITINAWLEELELGPQAPRSNQMMMSAVLGLLSKPEFAFIQQELRYQSVLRLLTSLQEETK